MQARCGNPRQGGAVSVGPIWHACIAIHLAKHRNSAECTENSYRAHCKVLYLQKQGIEPVANGTMVETVALKLMGCRFDP